MCDCCPPVSNFANEVYRNLSYPEKWMYAVSCDGYSQCGNPSNKPCGTCNKQSDEMYTPSFVSQDKKHKNIKSLPMYVLIFIVLLLAIAIALP